MEGCLVIVESPTEVRQRPVALVSLATAVWLGTYRSWQGPAIRNAASQKRPDAPSKMDEARKWLWSSTLLAFAAAARQSAAAKLLLSRRGGGQKTMRGTAQARDFLPVGNTKARCTDTAARSQRLLAGFVVEQERSGRRLRCQHSTVQ